MASSKMPQSRPGFKFCSACLIEKPLEEFQLEPRVRSKTTAKCQSCLYEYRRAWAEAYPDRIDESRKKYAEKYPERVLQARKLSNRTLSIARRERRLAEGKPLLEPRTTEDGRRCSRCRRRKPVDEFSPDAGHYDGIAPYCKSCAARLGREQLKSLNPEQRDARRRYSRRYDIKRNYGIEFDDAQALLVTQGGQCAICADPIDLLAPRSGCVDHHHETKTVRGILCVKCNAGIGQFRESEDFMLRAIAYLRRTKMAVENEMTETEED
jgi:hypothetical protein